MSQTPMEEAMQLINIATIAMDKYIEASEKHEFILRSVRNRLNRAYRILKETEQDGNNN